MKRREFLKDAAMAGAAMTVGRTTLAEAMKQPVIDTHIHLFDTGRPGGVPWPKPGDSIYRPSMPDRFQSVSKGLNVVGAIAIEASPLSADNDWLLGVVEKNPVMVGMIGDLVPGTPEFRPMFAKMSRSPLFLGFRYGNLWDRDLAADIGRPGFMDGLRELAKEGLVFESANPDARLIQALLEVAQKVPDLRIVIDHLPNAAVPEDAAGRTTYTHTLRELGESPHVFIKLSEILVEGNAPGSGRPPVFDKTRLDELWEIFGERRIVFGSDWPNSEHYASYAEVLRTAEGYVANKSAEAKERFFRGNSLEVYRWRARTPEQHLSGGA